MKRTFLTRNLFIGVLMGLVMVFGVQGIADALTLSKTSTSGDLQTKPAGSSFDITFSVTLQSDSTKIYDNEGRQIDEYGNEIDSDGYLIEYVRGIARRFISVSGTLSDANTDVRGKVSTGVTAGTTGGLDDTDLAGKTLKVRDPNEDRSKISSFGDEFETSPTGILYLDGTSVVDSDNRAVYIEESNGETGDAERWKYKRAKATPVAAYSKNASKRYAYNDEQITISQPDLATGLSTAVYRIDGDLRYPLWAIDATDKTATLRERDQNVGIPRSITLRVETVQTGTPVPAGTHTIIISDSRGDGSSGDYPIPKPAVNPLTFTLYTTTGTGDVDNASTITVDRDDRSISTSLKTRQIDTLYKGAAATALLNYQVIEGPGTLYLGAYDEPALTPTTNLTTAEATPVFLYLNSGDSKVRVYVDGGNPDEDGATITFTYTGTDKKSPREQQQQQQQQVRTPSLSISISGTGTTRSVTVIATNAQGTAVSNLAATLSGTALSTPRSVVTGTSTTITIPSAPGTYTLQAIASGYTVGTGTITVATPTAPGTLLLTTVGDRSGTRQGIRVTASGRTIPSGGLSVALHGVSTPRSVIIASGSTSVDRIATLPSATGAHILYASAAGYTNAPSITIPAVRTAAPPEQPEDPTPPPTSKTPSRISVSGLSAHSGTANTPLASPLSVRVVDASGIGVPDTRVTFRVRTGQGRLSQRGNGRAIAIQTDTRGYARTSYTPMSASSTVEAEAKGVTQTVTFTITTDGSAPQADSSDDTTSPQTYNVGDKIPISLEDTLNFTSPRTLNGITYTCVGPDECVVSYGLVSKGQIQAAPAKTTSQQAYEVGDKISISLEDTLRFSGRHTVNGTIYTCVGPDDCVVSYGLVTKGQIRVSAASATTTRSTREINPEVLLSANRRPPMVWVDGGGIYALVGEDVQAFAPSIENVMNVAVSGNKLYWTEQTGENTGTINSVNLDGTGAKELVSIYAVPRGIAVDPVAQRLYWTNSQGWIQSSNLEGKGRRNVISGGLEDPMGIAVSNGNVYWTQNRESAPIEQVNLKEGDVNRPVWWDSSRIDGLAQGLAIAGNKLYWTQMTGKNAGTINSINLDGTGAKQLVLIQAVPKGITVDPVAERLYWTNSQGWIQSSNLEGKARRNVAKGLGSLGGIALSANITAPAATKSTTAAANKYDINGDGTVDSKDSDVLIVAVAAGSTDAKYDVNGDGEVNVQDVVQVTANRSGGAASAPTLLGRKFSVLEVEALQEQIDLLIATNDRSPAAMRTLVYLQQLIVMARPEKTQLLANYPNPFNPETWMPYELATDTDVRITIYNAQGVVIRTLQLGQQSAGYYTDRERAAYWDGRNALGEQVASGIYFYQLETDTLSALRKMVILK